MTSLSADAGAIFFSSVKRRNPSGVCITSLYKLCLQVKIIQNGHAPLSCAPQPPCRSICRVLGLHHCYSQTLQNRIPACRQRKNNMYRKGMRLVTVNNVFHLCFLSIFQVSWHSYNCSAVNQNHVSHDVQIKRNASHTGQSRDSCAVTLVH